MKTIFGREPIMIIAVIDAAIALAVAFGLNWTGEQVSLTVAFVTVLLGLVARTQVTADGAS